MDSKDKSKIDERGKTHKIHKGKKKKEEDKANKDTRRKGLGNNMQQQQIDQDKESEGIEMISRLTLHQVNKGAKNENTIEVVYTEFEMESKEKVNEDMEIHS